MNTAMCVSCQKIVPAGIDRRGDKIYLVKDCPDCGRSEALVSSDAERYMNKHALDLEEKAGSCKVNCMGCNHKKPNLVFVDITNRCNMYCPICVNNTPGMGFLFEPPLEYFEKVFAYFGSFRPRPAIQLFGGEPTVRKDLLEIIRIARRHGLSCRLVTNGLALKNLELCKELAKERVFFLVAYDGANPQTYKDLRGTAKVLDIKHRAIDNICSIPRTKMTLMSMVARGYNDKDLAELFQFCHERRDTIRGIYFMPLAHSWNPEEFDLKPERITLEDIENVVADAFPDERIDFIPAGFASQLKTLLDILKVKALPFVGAHPNCESVYLLVSDGEKYIPLSHFIKGSLFDLGHDLMDIERRARKWVQGVDSTGFGKFLTKIGLRQAWLRGRTYLAFLGLMFRRVRLTRLLKGEGRSKLVTLLMSPLAFVLAILILARVRLNRHLKKKGPLGDFLRMLADRFAVRGVLQLFILPFEDKENIEGERLFRCPTSFGYYDPKLDEVRYVPVCAWQLFKKDKMREIAEYYGNAHEIENAKPIPEIVEA